MAAQQHAAHASAQGQGTAPFADVLCAVDGSRGSFEAVRQAVALARPDGAVRFLAVSHSKGKGLVAMAELSGARAQESLDAAARTARQAGLSSSTELRRDGSPADILLAEGERHDLLAVGSHGGSRVGGIMLGSTASQAAHRTEGPLLVARRTADEDDFPRTILLATNGSPGSWAALWMVVRIAHTRACRAVVIHVPDGLHPEWTRQIDRQIAVIEEATGAEPSRIDEPGRIAERIVGAAEGTGSSLIVIGRRGLAGLRALGSVSERVFHQAPCSTLLVPPPEGEG